jgi:hypothetical protein
MKVNSILFRSCDRGRIRPFEDVKMVICSMALYFTIHLAEILSN